MRIRPYRYTADTINCKLCTDYKKNCERMPCPWFPERLEAKLVSYEEAIHSIYHSHPKLQGRAKELIESFDGTMLSPIHQKRMDGLEQRESNVREVNLPLYYSIMYLFTANIEIFARTHKCFLPHGIALGCAQLMDIPLPEYILYRFARHLRCMCEGEDECIPFDYDDLADKDLVSDETFALLSRSLLIADYGLKALEITVKTRKEMLKIMEDDNEILCS